MLRLFIPLFVIIFFATSCATESTRIAAAVRIDAHVHMHATEVTVYEYMEFVGDNGCDSSLFPDDNSLPSPAYRAVVKYFEDQNNHRGRDLAFYRYVQRTYGSSPSISPITGITYEQALKFCKWKEEKINADPGHRIHKIHIGLPTIELYRRLIPNTDSLDSKNRCPVFNYKGESSAPCSHPWFLPPSPTIRAVSWPRVPNGMEGLFCLRGNVAEMTATKGIAMGGSFRQYAWECSPHQSQAYTKPEDWLGFRYIVTEQ